jgi:hypothetical protein
LLIHILLWMILCIFLFIPYICVYKVAVVNLLDFLLDITALSELEATLALTSANHVYATNTIWFDLCTRSINFDLWHKYLVIISMISGITSQYRIIWNLAIGSHSDYYVMCRAASGGAGDSAESCWGEFCLIY